MKTPTAAATVAGVGILETLQEKTYSKAHNPSRAHRVSWTLDANLFVVAFAIADRVTA